jgi:hypothetical protein
VVYFGVIISTLPSPMQRVVKDGQRWAVTGEADDFSLICPG